MKHTKTITVSLPAKAESILENQQKVALGSNIVKLFTDTINALGNLREFLNPQD
jgi:hypothetical protein